MGVKFKMRCTAVYHTIVTDSCLHMQCMMHRYNSKMLLRVRRGRHLQYYVNMLSSNNNVYDLAVPTVERP